MASYKVRRFLTTEDPEGKPARQVADVGAVGFVGNLRHFCRHHGVAFVRDLTKGGGGYGVDVTTGATFLLIGAEGMNQVSAPAAAHTAARQAEVESMVRRAPAKEVAALRRARRQAEARLYGAPRAAAEATEQRAEEALEEARADLAALQEEAAAREEESRAAAAAVVEAESAEAPAEAKERADLRAESARLERIARDLRADVDTAAKVEVAAARRLTGIITGRDSGARRRAVRRLEAKALEARRAAVVARRSLGREGMAALEAAEVAALEAALAAAAAPVNLEAPAPVEVAA